MSNKNIVIVGGGLAGLMATIKAAEAGVHVDLISLVPENAPTLFVRKAVSTVQ